MDNNILKWRLATCCYIIIMLCCCVSSHNRILPPTLLKIFSEIDFGMKSADVIKKMNVHHIFNQEVIQGLPKSDSTFNLGIELRNKFIFDPRRVVGMSAIFSDYYVASGKDTTLNYWLTYFEKQLNSKPIHLIRYDLKEEYGNIDYYVWLFKKHDFEIRVFSTDPKSKKSSMSFNADIDKTDLNNIIKYGKYVKIEDNGDTTKLF